MFCPLDLPTSAETGKAIATVQQEEQTKKTNNAVESEDIFNR